MSIAVRPRAMRIVAVGLIAVVLHGPTLRGQKLGNDLPGGKDHPMISRYAGSVLIGYDVQRYAELSLLLGPVALTPPGKTSAAKEQKVEGRVTRILYVTPEQRSSIEVFRNYEQELSKSGFQTLYSCAGAPCGAVAQHMYPRERFLHYNKGPLDLAEYAFDQGARDGRYIALRRKDPSGEVYVSLLIGKPTCCIEYAKTFNVDTFERAHVLLEVVETGTMSAGMVTVTAAAMAGDITSAGHTALYGIHFDTGRAEVKPDSEPALLEIVKLLKEQSALKLHVVGHTDNIGGLDANMALSDRRAAAVVRELTVKYGIAAARLHAAGVGSLAPVTPNDTEEGRAKNRRVELVKQ
jgi:OOP family OmpA-OmpF porin